MHFELENTLVLRGILVLSFAEESSVTKPPGGEDSHKGRERSSSLLRIKSKILVSSSLVPRTFPLKLGEARRKALGTRLWSRPGC